MRVKRFVAVNIQEAMAKVKSEMGNEAVILHTRHFKEGGWLGLFAKRYVEVTAAIDMAHDSLQTRIAEGSAVNNDLAEVKNILQNMSFLLDNSRNGQVFPKTGRKLYQQLIKQEVEDVLAQKTVKSTLEQLSLYSNPDAEKINSIFMQQLLKPLKKAKQIDIKKLQNKPLVYVFVGPTGVGKTTTIAKLAANFSLIERKKIAFVTVDTYRIAAVDQLKTIGDIMDVPVQVVYSPRELKDCLRNLENNDMIFIDTAGRSHKNAIQIEELKHYLETARPEETFIVLPATGKYQDLLDILSVYENLNITKLIFTKLDETSFYGPIYNIACRKKYPLSYFTNGQNIPDDIEDAEPVRLVEMVLKEQSEI